MNNRSIENTKSKTCEQCGALLVDKPPRQRFCGHACFSQFRRIPTQTLLQEVPRIGVCLNCHTKFEPSRSNHVYCSKHCGDRYTELRRYWQNNQHYKEIVKRKQAANPERTKQSRRRAHFKTQYGLPYDEYERMLETQKGICAICGLVGLYGYQSGKVKDRLCVDHDHVTDSVRGLLCVTCNSGLGMFRDSRELLQKASEYLKRFEAEKKATA